MIPENIAAMLTQLPFVLVIIWVFFEIEKRFSKYVAILFNQLERIGNKIDKLGTVSILLMTKDKISQSDLEKFIKEYYDCDPKPDKYQD